MLNRTFSRRAFVQHAGGITAGSLLLPTLSLAQSDLMKATLECSHTPTRAQTAGPFFTPNTPLRNDFRNDDPNGTPFQLVGFVKSPGCAPRRGAMVELWHADSHGRYDNEGYRMRGHQFTDAQGRFVFFTSIPGDYPGRTRHFHVTVISDNGRKLTTQLYFPNFQNNASDWIHRPELEMKTGVIDGKSSGRFDFVV